MSDFLSAPSRGFGTLSGGEYGGRDCVDRRIRVGRDDHGQDMLVAPRNDRPEPAVEGLKVGSERLPASGLVHGYAWDLDRDSIFHAQA